MQPASPRKHLACTQLTPLCGTLRAPCTLLVVCLLSWDLGRCVLTRIQTPSVGTRAAHPHPHSATCPSSSHVDGIRRTRCTQRNQPCGHVAGRTTRCGTRGNTCINTRCYTSNTKLVDRLRVCSGLRGSDYAMHLIAIENRRMSWQSSTSMCDADLLCVIRIVILR